MKTKNLLLWFSLLFIINSASAQSWQLTGNSNTNPATNFIGTTDSKAFIIRTNNIERIRVQPSGKIGIAMANPKFKLDVNGGININIDSAYYINGIPVLRINRNNNLIIGQNAGYSLEPKAKYNTMVGEQALALNRTGDYNTAMGSFSLFFLNSFISQQNTATGYFSLSAMEGGNFNSAFGSYALGGMTTGDFNVGVGVNALKTKNSSLGVYGGTAVGYNSLLVNSFGNNNTAVGYKALSAVFAGGSNTAIGALTNVNDSFNISNSTAIGNQTILTAENQIRLGNDNVTSIGGYANWSNISDGRVKNNIKHNVPGLNFINKLLPVTYNLNLDAAQRIVQAPVVHDNNGKAVKQTAKEITDRNKKQQIIYSGFVAQDVEKAAKSLEYDFSGVDAPKNDKDLYALRYAEFVVPLVKAVQELSKENEELKSRLEKLEQFIQLNSNNATATVLLSDAALEQNSPNPFNGSTVIKYSLPKDAVNSSINITNVNGRLIKSISLSTKGNGQLVLNANDLSAGTYNYSLIMNGKIIATKKMIIQ